MFNEFIEEFKKLNPELAENGLIESSEIFGFWNVFLDMKQINNYKFPAGYEYKEANNTVVYKNPEDGSSKEIAYLVDSKKMRKKPRKFKFSLFKRKKVNLFDILEEDNKEKTEKKVDNQIIIDFINKVNELDSQHKNMNLNDLLKIKEEIDELYNEIQKNKKTLKSAKKSNEYKDAIGKNKAIEDYIMRFTNELKEKIIRNINDARSNIENMDLKKLTEVINNLWDDIDELSDSEKKSLFSDKDLVSKLNFIYNVTIDKMITILDFNITKLEDGYKELSKEEAEQKLGNIYAMNTTYRKFAEQVNSEVDVRIFEKRISDIHKKIFNKVNSESEEQIIISSLKNLYTKFENLTAESIDKLIVEFNELNNRIITYNNKAVNNGSKAKLFDENKELSQKYIEISEFTKYFKIYEELKTSIDNLYNNDYKAFSNSRFSNEYKNLMEKVKKYNECLKNNRENKIIINHSSNSDFSKLESIEKFAENRNNYLKKLKKLEKSEKAIKDDISNLYKEYKNMHLEDLNEKITEIVNSIDKYDNDLEDLNYYLETKKQGFESDSSSKEIMEKFNEIKKYATDLEKAKNEFERIKAEEKLKNYEDALKKAIDDLYNRKDNISMDELKTGIKGISNLYKEYEVVINEYNEKYSPKRESLEKEYSDKADELYDLYEKLEKEANNKKEFERIKVEEKLKNYEDTLKKIIDDLYNRKNNISIDELKTGMKGISNLYKEYEVVINEYNEKYSPKHESLELEKEYFNKLDELYDLYEKLEKETNENKSEKEIKVKSELNIDYTKKLNVKNLADTIAELTKNKNKLNEEIKSYTGYVETDDLKDLKLELDKINNQIMEYTNAKDLLDKYNKLNENINYLNNEIKEYESSLFIPSELTTELKNSKSEMAMTREKFNKLMSKLNRKEEIKTILDKLYEKRNKLMEDKAKANVDYSGSYVMPDEMKEIEEELKSVNSNIEEVISEKIK